MSKTYLSERDYEMMEYALLYAKKCGIDKALEEIRRDLKAAQTANRSLSPQGVLSSPNQAGSDRSLPIQ